MTKSSLDGRALKEALSFAAGRFAREENRLNELDGAIGDGDHGITMRIGFEAIRAAVAPLDDATAPGEILRKAGTAFMAGTGGAIGVIFGKALMSGGKALGGAMQVGPAEFAAVLDGMQSAVASTGKAKPGDKTILDSIRAAAGTTPSQDLTGTMRASCVAAEETALATAGWACKVGRASRLGERSIGHPDPGATSFGIFLRALLEWCETEGARKI
jgi:phosphoenolpyruvate---glycerone phosphotransferase subunit DhaL